MNEIGQWLQISTVRLLKIISIHNRIHPQNFFVSFFPPKNSQKFWRKSNFLCDNDIDSESDDDDDEGEI